MSAVLPQVTSPRERELGRGYFSVSIVFQTIDAKTAPTNGPFKTLRLTLQIAQHTTQQIGGILIARNAWGYLIVIGNIVG